MRPGNAWMGVLGVLCMVPLSAAGWLDTPVSETRFNESPIFRLHSLDLSEDGSIAMVRYEVGDARRTSVSFVDTRAGRVILRYERSPNAPVALQAFVSPDSKRLAFVLMDKWARMSVEIHDAVTGARLGGFAQPASNIAFLDADRLIQGRRTGTNPDRTTMSVREALSGEVLKEYEVPGSTLLSWDHAMANRLLTVRPDRAREREWASELYDIETGERRVTLEAGRMPSGFPSRVRFRDRDVWLASGYDTAGTRLLMAWDPATGRLIEQSFLATPLFGKDYLLTVDGKVLHISQTRGKLRAIDLAEGGVEMPLALKDRAPQLLTTNGRDHLAYLLKDGTLKVFRVSK